MKWMVNNNLTRVDLDDKSLAIRYHKQLKKTGNPEWDLTTLESAE